MKAISKNGQIEVFTTLPETWNNIMNFTRATEAMLKAEGFFDLVTPDFDHYTQKLGEIYFDANAGVFTYFVENRTDLPTLDEAKARKLRELKTAVKDLYQTIQWYIEMKRADGEEIPQTVIEKIKLIKLKYEQVKTQINGLRTVTDVFKYELPYAAIETMKTNLDEIG